MLEDNLVYTMNRSVGRFAAFRRLQPTICLCIPFRPSMHSCVSHGLTSNAVLHTFKLGNDEAGNRANALFTIALAGRIGIVLRIELKGGILLSISLALAGEC